MECGTSSGFLQVSLPLFRSWVFSLSASLNKCLRGSNCALLASCSTFLLGSPVYSDPGLNSALFLKVPVGVHQQPAWPFHPSFMPGILWVPRLEDHLLRTSMETNQVLLPLSPPHPTQCQHDVNVSVYPGLLSAFLAGFWLYSSNQPILKYRQGHIISKLKIPHNPP